jgi:hypothetical protein
MTVNLPVVWRVHVAMAHLVIENAAPALGAFVS